MKDLYDSAVMKAEARNMLIVEIAMGVLLVAAAVAIVIGDGGDIWHGILTLLLGSLVVGLHARTYRALKFGFHAAYHHQNVEMKALGELVANGRRSLENTLVEVEQRVMAEVDGRMSRLTAIIEEEVIPGEAGSEP